MNSFDIHRDNIGRWYLFEYGLSEGITTTYPINVVIRYMKQMFGLDDKTIHLKRKNTNGVDVIITNIVKSAKLRQDIIKAMDLCGFFCARTVVTKSLFTLQFEPKHETDMSDELRTNNRFLYHITPKYNENKIKSIGLSPKSKNELFDFPNRIYFLQEDIDIDEIEKMTYALSYYNSSLGNNGRYVILTIDLNKVNDNTPFFQDPNHHMAVYTTWNIPKQAIIKTQYLNLNDKNGNTKS